MFCKYDGCVINVLKEADESTENYHARCIFIMKNQGVLDHEMLMGYSFVYHNMRVLGCTYSEEITKSIERLTKRLYITN